MIQELDARTKIIIVLVLSTWAIFFRNIQILLLVLLVSICISIFLKCDLKGVMYKTKKLFKIMIIIALVQSIFTKEGQAIFIINGFPILTYEGLVKTVEFILRVAIIVVSASIVVTSNYREIVQGLVQWKVPYEIAFMVSVAIRFMPIFSQELKDVVTAIQLRGIEIKKIPLGKKIKVYSYLFMPIVSSVIIKTKELSMAMEMKAFGAYPQRTSYMVIQMKKIDYIVISISVLCLLSSIFLYLI